MMDKFDNCTLSSAGAKEENDVFYYNDAGRGRKGGSGSQKNTECFNWEAGPLQGQLLRRGRGKEGKENCKGQGKGCYSGCQSQAGEKGCMVHNEQHLIPSRVTLTALAQAVPPSL